MQEKYEKTVLLIADAYSYDGMFKLLPESINDLAEMLSIDSHKLGLALKGELSSSTCNYNPCDILDREKRSILFKVFCRLLFIKKDLCNLLDSNDLQSIYKNIDCMKNILSNFELANADLDEYKCESVQDWYKNLLFDKMGMCFSSLPNTLTTLSTEKLDDEHTDMALLQYRCFIYEVSVRTNILYFFCCLFLIQDSLYLPPAFARIADQIINKIKPLATNGRLLMVQINNSIPNVESSLRGRTSDTAALQIIVGFDNYDAYYLRIDRAHKGQPNPHINIGTPGSFSSGSGKWANCFYFNEDEYKEIVQEHPQLENCFISHETADQSIYQIKEKANCSLSDEDIIAILSIIDDKSHEKLDESIDESDLDDFMFCLSLAMPKCITHINSDYSQEIMHFQYNHLMACTFLYSMAFYTRNTKNEEKAKDTFFDCMRRYKVEYEPNQLEDLTITDMCLALDVLSSKLNEVLCY